MIAAVGEEIVAGSLEERLAGLQCELRFDEPLAAFTSFQLGGPADALALPRDEIQLAALLDRCRGERIPVTVLGGGTNILVCDGGVRGVVISLIRGFREMHLHEEGESALLEAGAGLKTPLLVRHAAERGLEGLNCLSGVPGTVGGALAMNAGTAERYVGEAVESVRWIRLPAGGAEWLRADALRFSYRRARLPAPGIVLAVRFRLRRGEPGPLLAHLREDVTRRRGRQPWGFPCAGSIFRNPPGKRAGRLIEEAGLKGRRIGGAEVSAVHANFLVNRGGATASDVLSLIEEVQETVHARFGVELELELRVIGEDRR